MSIQLTERAIDEYRNRRGAEKTKFWRENKQEIIAQGQDEERKAKRKKRK